MVRAVCTNRSTQALILLGLALYLPSASVPSVLIVLHMIFFAYILLYRSVS